MSFPSRFCLLNSQTLLPRRLMWPISASCRLFLSQRGGNINRSRSIKTTTVTPLTGGGRGFNFNAVAISQVVDGSRARGARGLVLEDKEMY